MTYFHPAWLEHQRKRFTRPDAYRFAPPGTPEAKPPGWLDPSATRVRLKEAQEEEARAQEAAEQEALEREVAALRASHERARIMLADVKFELALRALGRKYSESQPRLPKGNPDGGQWTRDASKVGSEAAFSPYEPGGIITNSAQTSPVLPSFNARARKWSISSRASHCPVAIRRCRSRISRFTPCTSQAPAFMWATFGQGSRLMD